MNEGALHNVIPSQYNVCSVAISKEVAVLPCKTCGSSSI